jgi:large subunit ribosomal protein L23
MTQGNLPLSRRLLRPIVTEKALSQRKHNQYLFEVSKSLSKREIRQAVEEIFSVKVEAVRVMNLKGKRRRMGWFVGYRPDRKRALVKLREGERIELLEGG